MSGSFYDAALRVLGEADTPLHISELVARALEGELLARPGPNPEKSMRSRLATDLRVRAERSAFVCVAEDTYALRDVLRQAEDPNP